MWVHVLYVGFSHAIQLLRNLIEMELLEACKPGIKCDVCMGKVESGGFVVNFEQPIGILLVDGKKMNQK